MARWKRDRVTKLPALPAVHFEVEEPVPPRCPWHPNSMLLVPDSAMDDPLAPFLAECFYGCLIPMRVEVEVVG